ncbi:MAG TPA: DUF1343 domain-containing protein [Gemmatimonadales bacterium]|nr:DUF1343 domain-containing protein [Gemmatimonadales bacterium]
MTSRQWRLGVALVLGLGCPGRTAGVAPRAPVRPGLEVLLTDSFHLVRGRRVGLVSHQSGVDHDGVSGVDRLLAAGVRVTALFSPEHGFRGTADPGEAVATTTDPKTGLPIYSLYGRNSAPTDSMLADVDVLVIDLQDAGARYYTYLYTTVQVMRSAERRGLPVIVLDRPNPVGGLVQGNVLDTAYRTPVGLVAVPMRHGMTLGELARLARHDFGLTTRLTVVPVAGWKRSEYFDATGLPFIPPSPNLRSLEALIHYPGTCLFEGTTLSVGRGTDHPFEQVGAPWLDSTRVLAALARAHLPGVSFQVVTFTPVRPGDGKFADTLLAGIRLTVVDRAAYDPTRTALALLDAIAATGAPLFTADHRHFQRLIGERLDSTLFGSNRWSTLARDWERQRAAFLERRRPFLLNY